MGFKIQNSLGSEGMNGPVRLIVNPQTYKDTGLLHRLDAVIQLIETTGAKIADQNIEKMRIRQCGLEAIQQGLVRPIGKKCEVGLLFAHLLTSFIQRLPFCHIVNPSSLNCHLALLRGQGNITAITRRPS